MYEFTIQNKKTLEEDIIFGYNFSRAMEKRGYNLNDWSILFREYID